ncbi:MAG: glycine--tRNA ligase subunit beta [Alphaproteobacteria bacterium]|nr:glycine--tRNA ligase subunit beta [Alphaproteobacteria bacterium]
MQQELLLEFFTEEIPARFQRKALNDSLNLFSRLLDEYGAIYNKVFTFVSPRRLAIQVKQLQNKTKEFYEEKRGPKTSAPEKAIAGFLKSNNCQNEDLIERDGYFYLNIETKGKEIKNIINSIIEDFIANMPWQKSMRWYIEDQNTLSAFWVRPIRSILCIYDGDFIDTYIDSVGLKTCDYTFGHRFLSKDKIRVFDFDDYQQKLEKNYVMLDYNKKRSYIENELVQRAAAMGLCMKYDEALLDEVTGLVEYPFIHIGTIDEKFMDLPSVVLSTSMKVHQKYFSLTYTDSIMAPFFGTVTNVPGNKIMQEGLDRVLRARLSDAQFFYKEDVDATLEAFTQRLSNVVFHEKLGSIAQKVDRMMSIANSKEEHRTVALCKADLLTQMVGEFPELQGKMGEIYARVQSEDEEVCIAIREHYKPLGANDTLPETRTGARVSFFDKLDTLVGFFGVGIYPTGSKDPFALRRAALCIVRLLCDFKDDILDGETLSWYINTLVSAYSDQGIALDTEIVKDVIDFITDRLTVYISDKLDIDQEIVKNVIRSFNSFDFNFKEAVDKSIIYKDLASKKGFVTVEEAYKRAVGVIGDFKFDISNEYTLDNEIMKNLNKNITSIIDKEPSFDQLVSISSSLIEACENVLMNDNDEEIKKQNLSVLQRFIKLIQSQGITFAS